MSKIQLRKGDELVVATDTKFVIVRREGLVESVPIIRNEDYWVRYVTDAEFEGFGRAKKGGVALYHIKATEEETFIPKCEKCGAPLEETPVNCCVGEITCPNCGYVNYLDEAIVPM